LTGHGEPTQSHEGPGKKISLQQEVIKEETDEDEMINDQDAMV